MPTVSNAETSAMLSLTVRRLPAANPMTFKEKLLMFSRTRIIATITAATVIASLGAASAQAATSSPSPKATAKVAAGLPKLPTAPVVRIGFFANVTHAPALVAQQLRLFENQLGKQGTQAQYAVFNAGPAEVEALKGGAIDVAYIGPNPAITGYTTTGGTLLRIVSGVTSGGAEFVTKPSINTVADLKGKTFATPQLGNTQDVALRAYLKSKGYTTTPTGGGDVTVVPTDNATTLALFKKGQIDGAWLPQPWATRLLQAGAKVFLNEKSLWPNGQFTTTDLVATQTFLKQYPGTVRTIVQVNNSAIKYIAKNVTASEALVQQQIAKWTGQALPQSVIDGSWADLQFTWNPLAQTLATSADNAAAAGLLQLGPNKLQGIYDLRLLNSTLIAAKDKPVSANGLGSDGLAKKA